MQVSAVQELVINDGIAFGPSHEIRMPRMYLNHYLRLYLRVGAFPPRQPTARLPLALDGTSAFVSRLVAVAAVGADALIAYGFAGVSAFVSHGVFWPATVFGSRDWHNAMLSSAHNGR